MWIGWEGERGKVGVREGVLVRMLVWAEEDRYAGVCLGRAYSIGR